MAMLMACPSDTLGWHLVGGLEEQQRGKPMYIPPMFCSMRRSDGPSRAESFKKVGFDVQAPPGLERFAQNNASVGTHAPGIKSAGQSMKQYLQELEDIDPGLIVCFRQIYRLGPSAAHFLATHCRAFGGLERVVVPMAHIVYSKKTQSWCSRPSSVAFVVMATRSAAETILCQGASQVVAGTPVRAQRFVQAPTPAALDASTAAEQKSAGAGCADSDESQ